MSEFIPISFDDVVEASVVANGMYDLRITECQLTKTGEKSKNPGSPMYRVSIGFEDLSLNAQNISHFIMIPCGGEYHKLQALNLKRFLEAFNVPYDRNGLNLEQVAMEMQGCTARLEVQLTEPDANGNVYNRLIVPRLEKK